MKDENASLIATRSLQGKLWKFLLSQFVKCLTLPLPHCQTASLYHCFNHPLNASLPHCTTVRRCPTAFMSHCSPNPLPHCLITSMFFNVDSVPMPNTLTTLSYSVPLPGCPTAHHCPTASLSHNVPAVPSPMFPIALLHLGFQITWPAISLPQFPVLPKPHCPIPNIFPVPGAQMPHGPTFPLIHCSDAPLSNSVVL
jgi:hypothetical protein